MLPAPYRTTSQRSHPIANLLGRGRYLRLARLVWKLPT
jgi:hypothetical protein